MKASELARAIAEYFVDHPWTQGRSHDPATDAMCMGRAAWCLLLNVSPREWSTPVSLYDESIRAIFAFERAVTTRSDGCSSIAGYNDRSGRTVDDVIHMAKLVAEDLELEGL